jgi:pyruvate, orthophosphate dikinase
MDKKYLYFFGAGKSEGNKDMKPLLGGKGAYLAEMAKIDIPIPPGFTIITEACDLYYKNDKKLPEALVKEIFAYLDTLEHASGKRLGDPANPLLLSVRSGVSF